MEKEKIKAFSARITQANRSELIVITYEIIIEEIKSAKKAWMEKDITLFQTELKMAQKFLHELMSSLNFQYKISLLFFHLYKYVNQQIIEAMIKKTDETLDSVIQVIEGLQKAFQEVSQQDSSEPLMMNTQKLYAGLTYGRGTLNETFLDSNQASRGFKA